MADTENTTSAITLRDIYAARRAIAPWVRRSPLKLSRALSGLSGAKVHLKLETVHDTGAFKIRGATNRILALGDEERARGVVTVSTGNHGRAVAYAAKRVGIRAVVCMSELVPGNKVEGVRELGAEVHIVGKSQDDAEVEADRLIAEEGLIPVHPFDDPYVIAGQGTIGIELLEDLPQIDTVIVPLSGGGLMGGIALALKSASTRIRVIGVSMDRGAAMIESVRAGRPVAVQERATLADSLGGGIGLENKYTFELVRRFVDEYLVVDEAQIADGMRQLYRGDNLVAEGGASVAVAALIAGLVPKAEGNIVCLVSGGNVDMDKFTRIVSGEYSEA
jgi:threonine dehydratase